MSKAFMEGVLELTEEERTAARKANVPFLRERLGIVGNNFLLSRAPDGTNILHLLMQAPAFEIKCVQREVEEFIKDALEIFPYLICQTDLNNNNPVHEFARRHDFPYWSSVLDLYYDYFTRSQKEASTNDVLLYHSPLQMKNVQGNMPLHLAILAEQVYCARALMELDNSVFGYINTRKETPLHLLCQCQETAVWCPMYEELAMKGIAAGAGVMQDIDGLTPFLRAAENHNFNMIKLLYSIYSLQKVSPYKRR
ncbi:uncharacterized protein [Spinacia oleracea]|uniref:Uncharacterized protein isoform X1 n=1 Tax=Spinacia oleracea TaxID=3562 RepID=A0ABM3RNQ0_SPIOL|nr:uncharacterized protein LOC110798351 isoform X1 [Spinacia oleracea]